MSRKNALGLPLTEAALALGLLFSFFLPWLHSMGQPVSGPGIRDLLAGPHRLVSLFNSASRISADYRLSLFLWAVPLAAGCILMAIAFRRYRAWMAVLAGGLAVAAFFFLRHEIEGYPFHRLAWGSYLALTIGIALAMAPFLRMRAR
jgi:hypothetical protein